MPSRLSVIIGFAVISIVVLVVLAITLRHYLARARVARIYDQYGNRPKRRQRRALFAAMASAPGVLPLVWGMEIAEFGNNTAIFFGWLPAAMVAALAGGFAYFLTDLAPRHHRTAAAIATAVGFNAIYILILAAYLAPQPG